jgi:type I restriction enzyme R subunit
VNKAKAVEFTKRLDNIVKHYNDREADQAAVKRVLGDLTDELAKLIHDVQAEQASNESLGISYEEKAFYDILKAVSIKHNFAYAEDKFLLLAKAIKAMVEEKSKYAHFLRRADIKAQLERDLIMLLAANGYPPDYNEEVFQEIFDQTANFKKHIAEDTI